MYSYSYGKCLAEFKSQRGLTQHYVDCKVRDRVTHPHPVESDLLKRYHKKHPQNDVKYADF